VVSRVGASKNYWQLDTGNCPKLGISSDTVKFCNGY
jgi:hypothetical protein